MKNTEKTDNKKKLKRAYSPSEILKMKKKVISLGRDFDAAFGDIEKTGVVFIWANSGNGKSSFVMQFCKALCKFGNVVYNSLEEGVSLTMQNTLKRFGMRECNRLFLLIDGENKEDLSERLLRHKSADFVVIDSFQYFQMSYIQYLKFKELHSDKMLIFVSHADGKSPAGRAAKSVMFDATLKIWIEGYRAFSKGRFIGEKGYYDIWYAQAKKYWGES